MENLTDDNWQQTSKISVQMSPIGTFKIISPLLGNPLDSINMLIYILEIEYSIGFYFFYSGYKAGSNLENIYHHIVSSTIYILGVQLCFRRFLIDGCSGKCWSKHTDQKCDTESLEICQRIDGNTLVNLRLHHKFILDRRCQFSSQILIICGKFWFSSFIWRKLRAVIWSERGAFSFNRYG